MADRIRFHLDEHVDPAIATALRRAGIDVRTTIEADKKLRDRTQTNNILPKANPMTEPLNKLVQEASSQVHNNFKSFAKRLEEDILDEGVKAHYRFNAHVYESDNSLKHFWAVSFSFSSPVTS